MSYHEITKSLWTPIIPIVMECIIILDSDLCEDFPESARRHAIRFSHRDIDTRSDTVFFFIGSFFGLYILKKITSSGREIVHKKDKIIMTPL